MTPADRGPARPRPGEPGAPVTPETDRMTRTGVPPPPAFAPIETKLRAPRMARRLVRRDRLLDRLTGDDASLVVFCAPAGCGKTLTARQWLDADPRPWAWVQLDAGDNDPVTLLQYLARALLTVSPLDPAVLRWLELREPPVHRAILPALVSAASSAPPFVLVLDDTHSVGDPRCWKAVAAVLDGLSPGSSLAVCGRSDPPLSLSRLRALDQVTEVRYEDLVFDIEEMGRLLALHGMAVSADRLSELAEATEGWPAGVYLTLLSWRSGSDDARALPGNSTREVAEYLDSEVLGGLPPDLLRFLTRTSIVQGLTPGLCDALTGRDDSGQVLAAVQRDNLFLVPLDDEGAEYRYHHLFGDLLQRELRRREPHRLPSLHRRAARWFEQEDRVAPALHHHLAAGQVDQAADLVVRRWWSRYLTGRIWTTRRWLDLFSPEQIEVHPVLRVAAAWILAMTGSADLARSLLSGFDPSALDDLPTADLTASPRSSLALIRALLATDGPLQMREDAREAVRREGSSLGPWPALCSLVLGVAETLCDDDEAARASLRQAAEQGEAWCNGVDLAALGDLSLIAGDAGDWDEAEEFALEAVRRADAYAAGAQLPMAAVRLARDRLAGRDGDEDALADLEELLEQASWDFCPWVGVRAGLLLAEAHLARDEAGEAWRRLDEAKAILARWAPAPGLVRRIDALERSLQARDLVEPLSAAELRVLDLLPTNLTTQEIARQLGVSANTVGSHVKAIHRKLRATTRSEVVERASSLGLLEPRPRRSADAR